MSRSMNKVMLIGHLGRDPEMRYTPSGRPVTTFTVLQPEPGNLPMVNNIPKPNGSILSPGVTLLKYANNT